MNYFKKFKNQYVRKVYIIHKLITFITLPPMVIALIKPKELFLNVEFQFFGDGIEHAFWK